MTWRRLLRGVALTGALVVLAAFVPALATAATLTQRPQIAIGFDDAPQDAPTLLSILEQKGVKATFFIEGDFAELRPAQAQAIASAGMLIGNHSYDHPDFATSTPEFVYDNLVHAQDTIQAITGVTPHWYRSPYLRWNDAYMTVLPELGLQISWPTINPKDWAGTPAQDMIDLVREQEAAGGVVELHDMNYQTNTIEALPGLIDGLHEDGYELVTLDDIGYGSIEGSVTAAHGGTAVGGVLVTAYDSDGSAVATASTDAHGSYRLAPLDEGSYRVGFSAAGYVPGYYDGSSDLEHAQAATVTADYATTGADAALESIDHTPPVTLLSPGVPDGWVSQDVTFGLWAVDSQSPEGMVTYYRFDPPGEETTYTGDVTVSREGTTDVAYWSVDGSGNVEAANHARVRIDKTPPVTSSDARSTYSGSAAIHLAPTDTMSGVAGTHFRLDGGAETSGTVATTATAGAHALEFGSVDAAGNVEETRVVEFSVLTPTSLSARASARTPVAGATVAITGTLRDASPSGGTVAGSVRLQVLTSNVWYDAAVSTANSSGVVAFEVSPAVRTSYRLTYAGAIDRYEAAVSPSLTIVPKVSLGAPVAVRGMSHRRPYEVYGSLRPQHDRGIQYVRIYRYRKVRSTWVSCGYVKATVRDDRLSSRYEAKMTLGAKGAWRLRAFFVGDANHAATWSKYTYATVR